MYNIQPKKMIIMNILDILKKYTDENHRLSQKDICEILSNEYMMKLDRKTVKKNLMNLIDSGYNIEYSESVRKIRSKDGSIEESIVLSDFYLNRNFTDGELRLLIDYLLSSKHIPFNQCKELIKKLEGLSSVYFRSKTNHITIFPDDKTDNKQLFYHIELLDEAISKNRQVSFKYLEYGTDKKMHTKFRSDGSEREYIINPYQLAAKEGKYYLICNNDKYDSVSNYRLDRISDLKILETHAKPYDKLKWSDGKTLDLYKYITEHIYMYSSESIRAKFRIAKPMISDVIDLFGKDIHFSDETDSHITVTANVNEMSMYQFAKSYAPDVIVLKPKKLTDKLKEDLKISLKNYET